MNWCFDFLFSGRDVWFLIQCVFKILVSFVFGICIGWERRSRHQIIGIRTLLLICVSSTLLGILSVYASVCTDGTRGDPGRIAAAVITGIGFVGGGAIMHRGLNVKGVTTAAIIWATSAIGLSVGFGLYIPALFVFVILIMSLPFFRKVELKYFTSSKLKVLTIAYADGKVNFEKVKECINEAGLLIDDISILNNEKKAIQEFTMYVNVPSEFDLLDLNHKLEKTGKLIKFSFTES